ncbi:MAG: response regulator transcription factor [Lachnospira sp.]|nr:response regulator transcription factor [Lachnospira sp.]
MVSILVVEDDAAVRLLMRAKLGALYHILEASNGEEGMAMLDHNHVDLIISDIMMPGMDGYSFADTLRQAGCTIPIIMLTALDSFAHKKKGYMSGTDDYMTKPINYEELEWHIQALLRRARISSEKRIEIKSGGDVLVLNETQMSVTWQGQDIPFTDTEFRLLYLLLSYPGKLFTKQQIMDEIWGYDTETEYSSIKTNINRVRRKMEGCSAFEILSVRGLGYKAVVREKQAGENHET